MITNAINLMIICAFAFIPLLLGEQARNRSTGSSEDFILQGRRLGLFPMYATVFATWMSAFAFLSGITYFFEEGPIYMTTVGWDMLFAVLFILMGRRIWHYGRSYGYMTATDFFQDIYRSRILSGMVTIISIGCTMLYLQAQIAGAVIVIQVGTKGVISVYAGGIIFFAILVIYLWAGGLRAVAMTDIFYGALIAVAMISTGLFLMRTAGGTEEVFRRIVEDDPSRVSMSLENGKERVCMWIALFIIVPVGAFMGPQMWIRNYAAGSHRHFMILPLLLAMSSIICIGTLFSGSAGIVLATHTTDPSAVIIDLLSEYAHPFFYVFVITGIFAAIFSTANSQVHALAAIYAMDVHRRYINAKLPDRRLVSIAKWAILFISAGSWLLMIIVPRNVFDLAIMALGGMAQLMIPVAGALFWKGSSPRGAAAGILAGEGIFLLLTVLSEMDGSICGLIALASNGITFVITSFAFPPAGSVRRRIENYRREFTGRNY